MGIVFFDGGDERPSGGWVAMEVKSGEVDAKGIRVLDLEDPAGIDRGVDVETGFR